MKDSYKRRTNYKEVEGQVSGCYQSIRTNIIADPEVLSDPES
jgi:hypothetical protein